MSDESFKNSAHDLNNILTSIINGIELLKQSAESGEELRPLISKLENSAKRAMKIIHEHLTPNGGEKKQLEKIVLPELIQEVVDNLSEEEQKFIEVNSQKDMPFVLIDGTDLYRIIFNLIKNSLEALEDDGKIIINVSKIEKNHKNYVQINIVDNGIGINSENLAKIFDRKFSTKDKGQQSGFGLSIVKEKTEEYGGTIKVTSQKGKTEFTLLLPSYSPDKKGKMNILLAEDDISVNDVLADLLKSQGYNVSIATTGIEALSEIKKSNFDVLIIDKKMPEMDGIECIKIVRSGNPFIQIILASGSDFDLQSDELRDLNIGWVIKKPYNFPEILSALQKFDL